MKNWLKIVFKWLTEPQPNKPFLEEGKWYIYISVAKTDSEMMLESLSTSAASPVGMVGYRMPLAYPFKMIKVEVDPPSDERIDE